MKKYDIKEKISSLGYIRYKRVENYIKNLEENFKLKSKKDTETVEEINELIKYRIKRLKTITILSIIFYIGVYFSFVSFYFSNFFVLSEVLNLIGKIIGFFGTTIFFIGIFFTNRLKELYYQDLNLLTSHLISIYSKNELINENLFEENTNIYNNFINFFRKRGF